MVLVRYRQNLHLALSSYSSDVRQESDCLESGNAVIKAISFSTDLKGSSNVNFGP